MVMQNADILRCFKANHALEQKHQQKEGPNQGRAFWTCSTCINAQGKSSWRGWASDAPAEFQQTATAKLEQLSQTPLGQQLQRQPAAPWKPSDSGWCTTGTQIHQTPTVPDNCVFVPFPQWQKIAELTAALRDLVREVSVVHNDELRKLEAGQAQRLKLNE